MQTRHALMVLALGVVPSVAAQSPVPAGDSVYVVEYYYTASWGHADEFFQLYVKNHLPIMRLEQEKGHILDLVIERPRFHGTEDGRWDVITSYSIHYTKLYERVGRDQRRGR